MIDDSSDDPLEFWFKDLNSHLNQGLTNTWFGTLMFNSAQIQKRRIYNLSLYIGTTSPCKDYNYASFRKNSQWGDIIPT